MAEFLVLFACINATGCQDASSLYYAQHPEIVEQLGTRQYQLEQAIGTFTVQFVGPVLSIAAGRDYTAKIYKNLYIGLNKNHETLTFRKEF